MERYWNYLTYSGNVNHVHIVSQYPRLGVNILLWGVIFCAMYPVIIVICREIFPGFYAKVSAEKRDDTVSYIVSLIHHSVVVPLALYYFHQDYMRGAEGLRTVNYAAEYGWFVPWIFGYFIGDTMMFAVPQALHGKYEYLFHHILGLGLMVSAIYIESPTILKFCPHMLICELSTYFFSVAYLLRLSGHRGSRMVSVFEISFAIFFFLTRIVNLPLIMWGVKDVMMSEYMVCWIILVLVLALQFFWLYKIIMSLLKKKSNPETKKVE